MVQATAPGKIILFGEHAVVYGRPAIAVPLSKLRATATVNVGRTPGICLVAPDLDQNMMLAEAAPDNPLAAVISLLQSEAGLTTLPDMTITVHSDIPIASGLGSGAAITASVLRALAEFLGIGQRATNDWISSLTYEIEKIHHGTPSGIDNTVVAYEQPVYFCRRQPENLIDTFTVARPIHLLVADTGISSSTKAVVGDVRRQWQANPPPFETLFDACGTISQQARTALGAGETAKLGRLMSENHRLLQKMSVSAPALDALVTAAAAAGALGAKLSGAGRGGNMIALVTPRTQTAVRHALLAAGAQSVLASNLSPP